MIRITAGVLGRSLLLVLPVSCSLPVATIDRLSPDARERGYVLLPRSVVMVRGVESYDCGPEALCAISRYWGKEATVEEFSREIYDPEKKGTLSTDIAPAARRKGLKVEFAKGSLERIRQAIRREVPPLIMIRIREGLYHFIVVSGYSDAEEIVVGEHYDGAKMLLAYSRLAECWDPAGFFYAEMVPADAAYDLEVANDFASRGQFEEAKNYYGRCLQKEPKNAQALDGMGTCLFSQGKMGEAVSFYEQAHECMPEDAKICNNLANIYVSLGKNFEKAVALAEGAVERYREQRRRCEEKAFAAKNGSERDACVRELKEGEIDLALAFGTLGQARYAAGTLELAIAAWKASIDYLPLDFADIRAKRLLEIGRAYKRLETPSEARKHFEQALGIVKDEALKREIEAELK